MNKTIDNFVIGNSRNDDTLRQKQNKNYLMKQKFLTFNSLHQNKKPNGKSKSMLKEPHIQNSSAMLIRQSNDLSYKTKDFIKLTKLSDIEDQNQGSSFTSRKINMYSTVSSNHHSNLSKDLIRIPQVATNEISTKVLPSVNG